MILYIIRHAHVAYRRGVALAGVPPAERAFLSDPELSAFGRRQAARLAEHLAQKAAPAERQPLHGERSGFTITRLFTSPMRRALQTAQPLAASLGLQPEIWQDLHEFGGIRYDEGEGRGPQGFAGLTRAEIEAQFPGYAIPPDFADDGWWNRPSEGEADYAARLARVAGELRTLAKSTAEHIAIITHGTAASDLLHTLLGNQDRKHFHYNHYNTGVSSLEFRETETNIRYHNRIEHLPDDLLVR